MKAVETVLLADVIGPIKKEAVRRAKEDGQNRLIYKRVNGSIGIMLIKDFSAITRDDVAYMISYVFADGVIADYRKGFPK
ncbi:unnamed protein product [marine sediment metagenome]|uniref:Uncharacterized protein n=1 Tax=marine sediment metagenome TaxID=412755 RepID=X0WPB4_9ZZZZ